MRELDETHRPYEDTGIRTENDVWCHYHQRYEWFLKEQS